MATLTFTLVTTAGSPTRTWTIADADIVTMIAIVKRIAEQNSGPNPPTLTDTQAVQFAFSRMLGRLLDEIRIVQAQDAASGVSVISAT